MSVGHDEMNTKNDGKLRRGGAHEMRAKRGGVHLARVADGVADDHRVVLIALLALETCTSHHANISISIDDAADHHSSTSAPIHHTSRTAVQSNMHTAVGSSERVPSTPEATSFFALSHAPPPLLRKRPIRMPPIVT